VPTHAAGAVDLREFPVEEGYGITLILASLHVSATARSHARKDERGAAKKTFPLQSLREPI